MQAMSPRTLLPATAAVLAVAAAAFTVPAGAKPAKKTTYTGRGAVAAVEDGSLTVDFQAGNAALKKALKAGGLDGVTVRVGSKTVITVDGDAAALEDICSGDTASVRVVGTGRVSRGRFQAAIARSVTVKSTGEDCTSPDQEDDTGDDTGSGDPTLDSPDGA